MNYKQEVFCIFTILIITLIIIGFLYYQSYRIDKESEERINKILDNFKNNLKVLKVPKGKYLSDEKPGRWYRLELKQPAHCDDFPSCLVILLCGKMLITTENSAILKQETKYGSGGKNEYTRAKNG